VAGLLMCVGGVSLALRLALVTFKSVPDPLVQFSLPTTFFFFVAGMLVAVARLAAEGRSLRIGADTLLLCSLPVWAAVFYRYSWEPLCAVAAMLMLGACVLPLRRGRLLRALEWRPLAAVGVASYSLYMWHFPLVVHIAWLGNTLRSFVVLVPLSLVVAFASYYAIEAPFLRLRRRWAAAAPAQRPVEAPELAVVPETAS
jgi:peptidoglycan/LPS O-acetylase OafA/YrhL